MRVLLVGAGGFLGRTIHKVLIENGHTVIPSSRRLPRLTGSEQLTPHKDWLLGDLENINWAESVVGAQAVICTAASLAMGSEVHDWESCVSTNIYGFSKLFHWAESSGIQSFVFTSSAGLYKRPAEEIPISEQSEIRPLGAYWTTKLLAEQLMFSTDIPSMKCWALRMSSPYGPNQSTKSVLPIFVQHAKDGTPMTITGDRLRSQDFVWIEDAARAHVMCLTASSQKVQQPINLGSGEETSMQQLAKSIRKQFESTSEINFKNEGNEESNRFVLDISLAKKILGYQPVNLETGLGYLRKSYL
jgi:UDP-glucose 4-epimerase